jgi:NAD(P)-dependent dehydrogenase (short-subunit alcohol dehydrogenase family)
MSDWQGKVLIVTGTVGIAAEAARLAVAGGAHVVAASGDAVSGEALASELGVEVWSGDLSAANAAGSVLSLCLSKFGRVDALFNAAGLSGRRFGDGPVHECTDAGLETTLGHNLGVTFRMSRAVVGRMLDQRPGASGQRGAIVNLSSVLAESPEPRHFATHAYAAAKGGIEALSRSMAAYYATLGIRVNAVAPGMVCTPAAERTYTDPKLVDFLERKQPLAGGLIGAATVARAALFLLSEEAGCITGEVLRVDAGWSLSGV